MLILKRWCRSVLHPWSRKFVFPHQRKIGGVGGHDRTGERSLLVIDNVEKGRLPGRLCIRAIVFDSKYVHGICVVTTMCVGDDVFPRSKSPCRDCELVLRVV